MNGNASVTVIIPNFNSARFLQESIESVFAQRGDFDLREIIVVDDHSDAPGEAELLSKVSSLEKIRVVTNTRTKGPSGARNTGANLAETKWLAFLDADDIYLPDSLSSRITASSYFPAAGVITADFQIQELASGKTEDAFFKTRKRPSEIFGAAYEKSAPIVIKRPYKAALATAFCHSCSILIERNLFYSVGGYEESLRYMEDQHLWFKLALHSDFVLVPQAVFLYRIHGSNMTHRVASPFEYRKKMLDVVRGQGHPPELAGQISRTYIQGHWDDFRWHASRHDFGRAIRSAYLSLSHRIRGH